MEDEEYKNTATGDNSEHLFKLPSEIIQHIVSFLSLSDICRLGATCHAGYAVTHDERFWNLHLAREYKVRYFSNLHDVMDDDDSDGRISNYSKVAGIVHDPTLQVKFLNKSVHVLFSSKEIYFSG